MDVFFRLSVTIGYLFAMFQLDECPVSNLCSREDHDCTGANCVPTERVCHHPYVISPHPIMH